MSGWPDDALETLEFAACLELVAACAAGPLGAARVRTRRPAADLAALRHDLATVGEVVALFDHGDRLIAEATPDTAEPLARLRIEGATLDGPSLVRVQQLLAAARTVVAELRRVAEACPRAAELRRPLPPLQLDQRLTQSLAPDGQLLDSASPGLAAARRNVQDARRRLIRRLEQVLRALPADIAAGDTVTMRNGRYVIPVRRDSRLRPGGIVHDESGTAGTLFLEPQEVVELGNALTEAEADEARERERVLRELTAMLRPERATLLELAEMCVAVDDLVARARYAVRAQAAVPMLVAAEAPAPMDGADPVRVRLLRARHPLLLAGSDPVVPFDLELGVAERTLLVSGPNTGGKTVMLKAAALASALAQSGIVPPVGPGSVVPVFATCFADIGDRQSIAASLSTFSAHVAQLRRILDAADGATLILLDEVGSGTDPAEGAALAAAVLGRLTRVGALTLATTHLGALKDLATTEPGVVNGSLEFDEATLRPSYRFRKGMPGRSYGLAIARRLGIDEAVVAEAEARVPKAERELDRLLAQVNAQAQALQAREATLADRELAATVLAERLAAQQLAQAERERALASREKAAERDGRKQARSFVLEARKQVEAALAKARVAADQAEAREARRLVEQALGAENAALAALESGAPPEAPAPPAVAPGDRVRLPNGLAGEVLEVRNDGKLVLKVGSLKMVAEAAGAVRVAAPTRRERAETRVDEPAPPREAAYELDLRGLSGDDAEAATIAALDAAILAEQPYLRIIHGMGTGVVRDRVRRVVAADGRVTRFDFAPRPQGGLGVTIVEFG